MCIFGSPRTRLFADACSRLNAVPYRVAVLLQLSGVPGSGKSTLARGIASAIDCVVVDTDVLKSALIVAGVPVTRAGTASYATALALSTDLVAQGRSVILDSPCRYQELLDAGRTIAHEAGVRYGFIELWAAEVSGLLLRLDERTPRISQVASATEPVPGTAWEFGTAEETLLAWQEQLLHPHDGWLRLDAAESQEAILAAALRYLDEQSSESLPRSARS